MKSIIQATYKCGCRKKNIEEKPLFCELHNEMITAYEIKIKHSLLYNHYKYQLNILFYISIVAFSFIGFHNLISSANTKTIEFIGVCIKSILLVVAILIALSTTLKEKNGRMYLTTTVMELLRVLVDLAIVWCCFYLLLFFHNEYPIEYKKWHVLVKLFKYFLLVCFLFLIEVKLFYVFNLLNKFLQINFGLAKFFIGDYSSLRSFINQLGKRVIKE